MAVLRKNIFLIMVVHVCTSQLSMWAPSDLQTLHSLIFIFKEADDALEDLYHMWGQSCLEPTEFEDPGGLWQGLISPDASWILGQLTSADELARLEAAGNQVEDLRKKHISRCDLIPAQAVIL